MINGAHVPREWVVEATNATLGSGWRVRVGTWSGEWRGGGDIGGSFRKRTRPSGGWGGGG